MECLVCWLAVVITLVGPLCSLLLTALVQIIGCLFSLRSPLYDWGPSTCPYRGICWTSLKSSSCAIFFLLLFQAGKSHIIIGGGRLLCRYWRRYGKSWRPLSLIRWMFPNVMWSYLPGETCQLSSYFISWVPCAFARLTSICSAVWITNICMKMHGGNMKGSVCCAY